MTPPVSVVIPTLGGEWLSTTIDTLNSGTLRPDEILLCIPSDLTARVDHLVSGNVRVVAFEGRGQVAQRALGFRSARCPLVLQLDDDVLLDADCLERLVGFVTGHADCAVGPAFYDTRSGRYHSFRIPSGAAPTLYERILFWIINGRGGYRPGKVGRSGVNMGVPEAGDLRGLDWLPGGCILHHRDALVANAFYPFRGKAFAEDLFHSHLLREAGITLARCGAARCRIDLFPPGPRGLAEVLRGQRAYARAMRAFVEMSRGSLARLHLYLAVNLLEAMVRKFRRMDALPPPEAGDTGITTS